MFRQRAKAARFKTARRRQTPWATATILKQKEVVMKKPLWNLVIDAVMALQIGALAGIGFLIKFVLVPGEERNVLYGRGTALRLLGLERHEWGAIHMWIGISLLAILVLHIILHWGQVLGLLCAVSRSLAVRLLIVLGVLLLAALLMSFPLWVKPEITAGKGGEGHRWGQREGRGLGPLGGTQP